MEDYIRQKRLIAEQYERCECCRDLVPVDSYVPVCVWCVHVLQDKHSKLEKREYIYHVVIVGSALTLVLEVLKALFG